MTNISTPGDIMEKPAPKYYTPEEYLAMEETAEFKSEYYQGEIFPFAGGSLNHDRIAGNLYINLSLGLKGKKCEVFSGDIRVWIESQRLFTYPDVTVVCGKPGLYENRNDTITTPLLIVEVLSESTQNYDRGQKFFLYRAIESLKEYVLVDQYQFHVEHFSKAEDGRWVLTEYNKAEDIVSIPRIDFHISLKDIYDRVEFSQAEKTPQKSKKAPQKRRSS